jgi:hypothetical protein
MAHGGGSAGAIDKKLLADFFEKNQGMAVTREDIISKVPTQLDPMNRLRRNGGARDLLDKKGIALLWGGGRDKKLICRFGLGNVSNKQFISYTPKTLEELNLLRANGHASLETPPFLQ